MNMAIICVAIFAGIIGVIARATITPSDDTGCIFGMSIIALVGSALFLGVLFLVFGIGCAAIFL